MGRIIERVRICGTKHCFDTDGLVDTGADITIVSRDVAEKIGAYPTGRQINLRDVSGNTILADEALVNISIHTTGCSAEMFVAVPRDRRLKEVLIGNDFMQKTKMGLAFVDGHYIWCRKR